MGQDDNTILGTKSRKFTVDIESVEGDKRASFAEALRRRKIEEKQRSKTLIANNNALKKEIHQTIETPKPITENTVINNIEVVDSNANINNSSDAEIIMLDLEKRLHELQTKKHEYFTLLKQILHEDEKRKQEEAEKRRAEEAQRIIIQREELRVKQEQMQHLQSSNFLTQTPTYHNQSDPNTSGFYNQSRTLFNNQSVVGSSSNSVQTTQNQQQQQHIMNQIPQVMPQQILRSPPPMHQPTIINYQQYTFADPRTTQSNLNTIQNNTSQGPQSNLFSSDHSRQLPLQSSVLSQQVVSGNQSSFFSNNQGMHYSNNFMNNNSRSLPPPQLHQQNIHLQHMQLNQMMPTHCIQVPAPRQNISNFQNKPNTHIYQNAL